MISQEPDFQRKVSGGRPVEPKITIDVRYFRAGVGQEQNERAGQWFIPIIGDDTTNLADSGGGQQQE